MESQNPNQINKDWFMRHRIFLATLVIVICGSGLIYQKELDNRRKNIDTSVPAHKVSDLKTYSNYQFGFEFQYPSSWSVTSENDPDRVYQVQMNAPDNSYLNIHLDDNPENLNISNFYKKDFSKSFTLQVINNQNFYTSSNSTADNYIANGNKIYVISISAPANISNQILSTFKFTDAIFSDGLKSYTNTKYGYTITYPAEWKLVIPSQYPPVPKDQGYGFALANFDLPQDYLIYTLDPGQIFINGGANPIQDQADCKTKATDYINGQEIIIDGVKGVKYSSLDQPQSMEGEGRMDGINVDFSKNNICYGLELSPALAKEEFQTKFNNIITSFKFTK